MAFECPDFLARRSVPQAGGLVLGSAHHIGPVGIEGDGRDSTLMPSEGADFLTARRVPEPDDLIVRGGEHACAIGAEGDGSDGPVCNHANPLMQTSKTARDGV